MQYAFYFDQTRCMGCNTCTVACKDYNEVNPGPVRWRNQETHEQSSGSVLANLSMSCNHCDDPACMKACPAGAITKSSTDGVVTINRNACIGDGSCVAACPFGAAKRADDKQEPTLPIHPMQKCTLCTDRLAKGEKPSCVAACPAHALDCGTVEEMAAKEGAERMNYANFPFAYKANAEGVINQDTGPNFYIKRKTATQTITKLV